MFLGHVLSNGCLTTYPQQVLERGQGRRRAAAALVAAALPAAAARAKEAPVTFVVCSGLMRRCPVDPSALGRGLFSNPTYKSSRGLASDRWSGRRSGKGALAGRAARVGAQVLGALLPAWRPAGTGIAVGRETPRGRTKVVPGSSGTPRGVITVCGVGVFGTLGRLLSGVAGWGVMYKERSRLNAAQLTWAADARAPNPVLPHHRRVLL